MPATTPTIGIVSENELPPLRSTPPFSAFVMTWWYVSGLCVNGCANWLKSLMNAAFDVNSATSAETTMPTIEKASSENMKRLAHVQPAATAAPATRMATVPMRNCQPWLVATVLPQLTSVSLPPTSPTMTSPGATPRVVKAIPSKAIERKLESEMQTDETTPATGCRMRLTST